MTDIEEIAANKKIMSRLSTLDAFEFMKKKNLPATQAPWQWDSYHKEHCSRCGSDKIFKRKEGEKVFRLAQCTSAVRYYSVIEQPPRPG
jgi:hypothetical protein